MEALKLCSLQFQTFLTQINSSLVDSNMLVRCIVLSLDRFESQTEDVKGKPGSDESAQTSSLRIPNIYADQLQR